LHRTLCGDGLATFLASIFGAPANTTYGENTGVLNLTKVFDPAVIRLAACFAIVLSFCPKFACLIGLMPAATIGGVSLILYGMISAVGVRNLVETSVDFSSSRNVFVAALIMVVSIGVQYGTDGGVKIGSVAFSGLALAALVGIFLNAILPNQLLNLEQDVCLYFFADILFQVEQLIDFFSFFQIREIALHYCIDVEAGCGTRSQIQ
jgi:uracil permease